jgi:hypothetical protein
MSIDILFSQTIAIIPARLSDRFDLTTDTWFVIAAVLTLWIYIILAPGREPVEA